MLILNSKLPDQVWSYSSTWNGARKIRSTATQISVAIKERSNSEEGAIMMKAVLTICLCSVMGLRAFQTTPILCRTRTIASRSQLFAAEDQEGDSSSTPPEETPAAADDILNSPAFLKRKVDVLKSDIAAAEESMKSAKERLEAGKAEWGSSIAVLQKEYQNMQKRMNTESNSNDEQAVAVVVRKMLDVLDNFDRAFGAVQPANEAEEATTAEYREVYQNMLDVFKDMGVEEIETVGTEFDYEVHQAVMQRPVEGFEENIVCTEFSKGFKVGDVLIRAAMVAVAA